MPNAEDMSIMSPGQKAPAKESKGDKDERNSKQVAGKKGSNADDINPAVAGMSIRATPMDDVGAKDSRGPSAKRRVSGLESASRVMEEKGVKIWKSNKLLWEKQVGDRIYDVCFFGRGQIAVITYVQDKADKSKKSKFECAFVNLDGEIEPPLFPLFLTKPLSVSGSRDGKTLAILDNATKGTTKKYNVNLYTRNEDDMWSPGQFTLDRSINIIAMMPDGVRCLAGSSKEVVLFDVTGKVNWSITLTGGQYVPWLLATPDNLVIIGDADRDVVLVHDEKGEKLREFSTQFLKSPSSMCVDSKGEVMIFDNGNKMVSLFSTEGQFIRMIMKADWAPGGMGIYKDKYFVSRSNTKLYLHEFCSTAESKN